MRASLIILVLLLMVPDAHSQAIATLFRGGTGGVGGDIAFPIAARLQMRVGGTYVRWRPGRASEKYGVPTVSTGSIRLGAFGVTLDMMPGPDWFRISAGAWSPVTEGRSHIEPRGALSIDDAFISEDDLGEIDIRVTLPNAVAPYVGVGIGNPLGEERIAMLLDFGFYYHGTPLVDIEASGRIQPTENWEDVLAQSMRALRFYPVAQVGVAVRW